MKKLPDIVSRQFGKSIKGLRVQLGLSQERFALKAGIDRSFVGKLERGERQATITTFLKVAAVLNVLPSELMKESLDQLYLDINDGDFTE